MVTQFRALDLSNLITMLRDFTAYYENMLTIDIKPAEFEDCKDAIILLKAEIEARKELMPDWPANHHNKHIGS